MRTRACVQQPASVPASVSTLAKPVDSPVGDGMLGGVLHAAWGGTRTFPEARGSQSDPAYAAGASQDVDQTPPSTEVLKQEETTDSRAKTSDAALKPVKQWRTSGVASALMLQSRAEASETKSKRRSCRPSASVQKGPSDSMPTGSFRQKLASSTSFRGRRSKQQQHHSARKRLAAAAAAVQEAISGASLEEVGDLIRVLTSVYDEELAALERSLESSRAASALAAACEAMTAAAGDDDASERPSAKEGKRGPSPSLLK
eukprot:5381643-Prymnesium_polylepis.1